MKRILISAVFFAAGPLAAAQSNSIYHAGWNDFNKDGKKEIYEDPSQPVSKRVADLLKRMTLDEKIVQLWQVDLGPDTEKHFGVEPRKGEISSCLGSDATVETPTVRNQLQHIVVEQSRLGVPLIFGHDFIHGFGDAEPVGRLTTTFPRGVGQSPMYYNDYSTPRPVRELKGFLKILLHSGETRVAKFTLPARELGYFDSHGNWLVKPGKYQLWISEDSQSGEPANFELKP